MGETTGISWCDHTVNYWLGCHEVGPGCDNCYARHLVETRFKRATWGVKTERVRTSAALRGKAATWNNRAQDFLAKHGHLPRVFVNSLSDVFDKQAPDEWRQEIWDHITRLDLLNWILVTKRIGNAAKMLPAQRVNPPRLWRPNLIILATVVNQTEWDRDKRSLMALQLAGFRVGLSIEPCLGPIDLGACSWLDWIICGGESRQGGVPGRDMPEAVALSLRSQADRRRVPFHLKQMSNGAPIPAALQLQQFPAGW